MLVLSAAGAHAGWNLVAKRAGGGLPFVRLCATAGLILYATIALVQLVLRSGRLSVPGLVFMAGSGALHAGYFGALREGYAVGDLSLVYPLARGIGPLLSVIAAIIILRERVSAPALLGACLINAAVLSLARSARRHRTLRAVGLAVLAGTFTGAYIVWDAHAVTTLHQPVIVYFCGAEAVRVLLLGGLALSRCAELRATRQAHWRSALAVGALSPGAYILVLLALQLAPVIVVAPAREVSIVFGVLIGATTLRESHAIQRALAATAILAGIALLALT